MVSCTVAILAQALGAPFAARACVTRPESMELAWLEEVRFSISDVFQPLALDHLGRIVLFVLSLKLLFRVARELVSRISDPPSAKRNTASTACSAHHSIPKSSTATRLLAFLERIVVVWWVTSLNEYLLHRFTLHEVDGFGAHHDHHSKVTSSRESGEPKTLRWGGDIFIGGYGVLRFLLDRCFGVKTGPVFNNSEEFASAATFLVVIHSTWFALMLLHASFLLDRDAGADGTSRRWSRSKGFVNLAAESVNFLWQNFRFIIFQLCATLVWDTVHPASDNYDGSDALHNMLGPSPYLLERVLAGRSTLLKTFPFNLIHEHHQLHHLCRGGCNYNIVVLGADIVFGTQVYTTS